MTLLTEAELAEQLKITEAEAAELRRKHKWPHVRLGRFNVRYTEGHLAEIVAMHTEANRETPTPGRLPGQTARSAAYNAR
ncbi:MAG: hypothetical protein HZY75_11920 [Nocardioidaceae bacterium]|nr:MAG: hypothetical protein HZY75_11920 [Nocardioidaceae bacterium]